MRRHHCLACGNGYWALSEGLLNLLIPAALWATLAIALGWAAGRSGLDIKVLSLARDPQPESGDPPAAAGRPTATNQLHGEPVMPTMISPASELAVLIPLWVQSWAEGGVEEYAAFYSPDFLPPGGRSMEEWIADQCGAPEQAQPVQVELSAFVIESDGDNRARVLFTQRYSSNGEPVLVETRLQMVRQDGMWRILREERDFLGVNPDRPSLLPEKMPETEYPGDGD